jgi:hypothetical protein
MVSMRRRAAYLVCAIVSSAVLSAAAASSFPFGSELMLDTAPSPGSKRMPMIEIDDNGAASIDLWCASVRGQATIGADTVSIVPGTPDEANCTPERQSRDQELLAALAQVTGWRRSGEVVEFIGATTLRYRLMTN